MSTNVYVPGVCNIGPAEIRTRRLSGILGLVVTVVFLAVALILQFPAPWRLFVFIPAALGASGFLQAGLHFCARFGMSGLFNFGDAVGVHEEVYQQEYRQKDQRKAIIIIVGSVLIGAAVAVIALLLP